MRDLIVFVGAFGVMGWLHVLMRNVIIPNHFPTYSKILPTISQASTSPILDHISFNEFANLLAARYPLSRSISNKAVIIHSNANNTIKTVSLQEELEMDGLFLPAG